MPDFINDTDVPYAGKVGGLARVWKEADATLTRPANATAYAAHGAIGSGASTLFKFSSIFRKNGSTGILTGARLFANATGIATTNMGAVRMHLFNASPSSPPAADQSTFTMLNANRAANMGFVDFGTWNIGGTGSDIIVAYGSMPESVQQIAAGAAALDLYAILEATAAFTPIASIIVIPQLSLLED